MYYRQEARMPIGKRVEFGHDYENEEIEICGCRGVCGVIIGKERATWSRGTVLLIELEDPQMPYRTPEHWDGVVRYEIPKGAGGEIGHLMPVED